MTTLVCLHGYTMTGAGLLEQLGALRAKLEEHVTVVAPEGTFACEPEAVQRFYGFIQRPVPAGAHRTWWDASDDGRVYAGFEETRVRMAELFDSTQPAIVLGFSQGAMLAAAVAALSARGELPPIRAAILVAGRVPRAEALQPLFSEPIATPSLHVWGDRDVMTGAVAPALVERFVAAEVARWPGGHVVPRSGPAADAILEFVTRHAG